MQARIVQIIARYLGVFLTSVATWLMGEKLDPDQVSTLTDVILLIATGIGALGAFLVDLIIHRVATGGVLKPPGQTARALALLVGIGAMLPFTVGMVGCAPRHSVNAQAIAPLVGPVTARHNAYVAADPTLAPEVKADYTRSADLLKRAVDEALTPPAPAPAPGP